MNVGKSLQEGQWDQVENIITHSRLKKLPNDADTILTANAFINYQLLIQHKQPSIEGELVENFINRKMWENMHMNHQRIFDVPISYATEHERMTSMEDNYDQVSRMTDDNRRNAKFRQINKLKERVKQFEG